MPLLKINRSRFSKKYLVIHDKGITEFTDGKVTTIVIPPHMVRDGVVCASRPVIAEKLDSQVLTYQQLQDQLELSKEIQTHALEQLEESRKDKLALQELLSIVEQKQKKVELQSMNWETVLNKLQPYYDTMSFKERFKFLLGVNID